MNTSNEIKDFFNSIQEYVLGTSTIKPKYSEDFIPSSIQKSLDDLELDDTTLYRGLYFADEEALLNFLNKLNTNDLETDTITSWTTDTGVSQDFMFGAGYRFYNKNDNKNYDGFGIVISYQPENKDLVFSYDIVSNFMDDFKELTLLSNLTNNEEEMLLKPGKYKVEITYASENCLPIISSIDNPREDIFSWVEYLDDYHDAVCG